MCLHQRVFPIKLWWIMLSKNDSVNSTNISFICESMQGFVWALSETLTDSSDYLTSWLTTQMPDIFSSQLQAGRCLSLWFRWTISFLLRLFSSFIIYHSFLVTKIKFQEALNSETWFSSHTHTFNHRRAIPSAQFVWNFLSHSDLELCHLTTKI